MKIKQILNEVFYLGDLVFVLFALLCVCDPGMP